MKKLATLIALLLAGATARADIIDLTPGGYDPLNLPPIVTQFQQQIIDSSIFGIAYAQVNTAGFWLSQFHHLTPPLVSISGMGDATETLSWDMTGTPFSVSFVDFNGPSGLSNLYQVTSPDDLRKMDLLLTIDGREPITQLALFGPRTSSVPDDTFTLALFGIAIGCLFCASNYERIKSL